MTMRSAILAGGHASRYGGKPKGLESVGGERILDRLIEALTHSTGVTPVLIANHKDAGTWRRGLTVVPDVRANCGTLGGLLTAVTAGDGPVLIAAWDMPFVSEGLLQALVTGCEGYDVFLPASDGPRGLEPLCGVYGPACRVPMEQALDDEDYRAIAFHDQVTVGILPLDQVRTHGDPEALFFNVNTTDDLAKAETLWRARG